MQGQHYTFQQVVLEYYRARGRHELPWRKPEASGSFDPYKILVSEIMLQQTQVQRVAPKFTAFIQQFPTFATLAEAPLAAVLTAWSGLGYNRRAKFLWQSAQYVVAECGGVLPRTRQELVRLPGVGPNTAGALLAYAYNISSVYIETNIRTAYIHHFFANKQDVPDRIILDVVAATLPADARTWYWALMDYGSHLKQSVGNLNKQSKQYTVQSKFAGSRRQLRGQVLRLLAGGPLSAAALHSQLADARTMAVLGDLVAEGLIEQDGGHYKLAGS